MNELAVLARTLRELPVPSDEILKRYRRERAAQYTCHTLALAGHRAYLQDAWEFLISHSFEIHTGAQDETILRAYLLYDYAQSLYMGRGAIPSDELRRLHACLLSPFKELPFPLFSPCGRGDDDRIDDPVQRAVMRHMRYVEAAMPTSYRLLIARLIMAKDLVDDGYPLCIIDESTWDRYNCAVTAYLLSKDAEPMTELVVDCLKCELTHLITVYRDASKMAHWHPWATFAYRKLLNRSLASRTDAPSLHNWVLLGD